MFFYVVKVIQIYSLGLFSRPKAKKRSRDLGDIPHPKVSRVRRVVDDEPKDSTTPPHRLDRLVRLIVSNTSSGGSTHCSDGSSDAKADFLFRGPPVCLIRNIRDECYAGSEATWEHASDVNKEALDVWPQKEKKELKNVMSVCLVQIEGN